MNKKSELPTAIIKVRKRMKSEERLIVYLYDLPDYLLQDETCEITIHMGHQFLNRLTGEVE